MTPDELVERVIDAMLAEDNYYASRDQARAAIRVVLEEAAKVVWAMRRDPLTMAGDHHGQRGEWMRAALDDAETAIRALMPKENT